MDNLLRGKRFFCREWAFQGRILPISDCATLRSHAKCMLHLSMHCRTLTTVIINGKSGVQFPSFVYKVTHDLFLSRGQFYCLVVNCRSTETLLQCVCIVLSSPKLENKTGEPHYVVIHLLRAKTILTKS